MIINVTFFSTPPRLAYKTHKKDSVVGGIRADETDLLGVSLVRVLLSFQFHRPTNGNRPKLKSTRFPYMVVYTVLCMCVHSGTNVRETDPDF